MQTAISTTPSVGSATPLLDAIERRQRGLIRWNVAALIASSGLFVALVLALMTVS